MIVIPVLHYIFWYSNRIDQVQIYKTIQTFLALTDEGNGVTYVLQP